MFRNSGDPNPDSSNWSAIEEVIMKKTLSIALALTILLTITCFAEKEDRTLDISLNTFLLNNSYGRSTRRNFAFGLLSIDFMLNLSKRVGLYLEGGLHSDEEKEGAGLISLGIEKRWNLNHSERNRIQAFGRIGAGIHHYSKLTFQFSSGSGVKVQLGKRIWLRGPELDVFFAKDGYFKSEVLKPQFRFLLGLLVKI